MPDSSVPGLIAALGEAIGIPALRADAQGCCRLLFDGDRAVEIRCAPAQGRWLLSCALRGQRAEGPALQVLMQGNHIGRIAHKTIGKVGNVNQSVFFDSDITKRAKVCNIGNYSG